MIFFRGLRITLKAEKYGLCFKCFFLYFYRPSCKRGRHLWCVIFSHFLFQRLTDPGDHHAAEFINIISSNCLTAVYGIFH
jgi:hypothetical protein